MRYLFLISLLILAIGCEDMLTPVPENSMTFNNIKTEKDIESILNGAGRYVVQMAKWNEQEPISRGGYTSYRGITEKKGFNLEPGFVPNAISWDPFYKVINQANIVPKFIYQVELTKDRQNFYLGQAYFYKAFAYFFLIRNYGDCVLIYDDPIISAGGVAKSPWTQVADYAIKLAENAAALLPDFEDLTDSDGQKITYKSIPCKGAANALLAYLCAWKAGGRWFANEDYDEMKLWRQAELACSRVIDSTDTYRLAVNPEEVVTNVLRGNSSESVYETVIMGMNHEITSYESKIYTCGIANMYVYNIYPVYPNATFASIITKTDHVITNDDVRKMYSDGDLRRDAYFYKFNEMAALDQSITNNWAYFYKYRYVAVYTPEENQWMAGQWKAMDCNRVWWRLADVILLRAECRSRLGDDAGAIADLNRVRARANATPYDASEYNGDLRFAIFKEREKELLAEGQRWYDMIRNDYIRLLMGKGYQEASEQDYKDGLLFLPLQIDVNLNPKLRQNTYWLKHAK